MARSRSVPEGLSRSPRARWPVGGCLALIWAGMVGLDRLWLARDRSVPAWDQTHHLTGSLNYLHALQQARWLEGDWWRELWMLSSKNPPLTYLASAPGQQWFGPGPDTALLVTLPFSALLLATVFALGGHLFDRRTGLWAAALTALLPGLYDFRLEYLTDYPLVALVTAGFWSLTVWSDARSPRRQWIWALAVGLWLGLSLLTKQSALFFFVAPGLWVLVTALSRRAWGRLLQIGAGLLLAGAICLPWYQTNWIFFIGAYQDGIASAAIQEGDPPLNTLEAWIYYARQLPQSLSWPLLLLPLVSGLLAFAWHQGWLPGYQPGGPPAPRPPATLRWSPPLLWLLYGWGGAYLLCSALVNKDSRYVMPYLPLLALLAARGLVRLPERWRGLRWGALAIATVLMLLRLFPLAPGLAPVVQGLSPGPPRYPDSRPEPPHPEIIATITQAAPHLQATLGVLVDTPTLNHNNLNYYGALAARQVYGREVGVRDRHRAADAANLSWLLLPELAQRDLETPRGRLAARVAASPEFQRWGSWALPEGRVLLYQRQPLPVAVEPLSEPVAEGVRLEAVEVPAIAPPGEPVPVTYTWTGPGAALERGLVLLTWQAAAGEAQWWQDGAIARGELFNLAALPAARVTETTAMLPPADLPAGTYQLTATYLDPATGATTPIPQPAVSLTLAANAPPQAAPPLDRVTILRELAKDLPQGRAALDPVFDTVGQINQYDPVQDYVRQADQTLRVRLATDPEDVEAAYALALAQILQEDAATAVTALERVVQLDAENPMAHAYLAFLHLYRWQPRQARAALKPALALAPELPEVQLLDGVTAVLELNWPKAWQVLRPLLTSGALASAARPGGAGC